jgi:hypothetical protein
MPIGLFKKSELGQPMRLYYYLSPLDLIQHYQQTKTGSSSGDLFNSTYKILGSLTIDQLIQHELGSYVTICLQSSNVNQPNTIYHSINKLDDDLMSVDGANTSPGYKYRLPDCSLLALNESNDDWHEYFNPYMNQNFNFEK